MLILLIYELGMFLHLVRSSLISKGPSDVLLNLHSSISLSDCKWHHIFLFQHQQLFMENKTQKTGDIKGKFLNFKAHLQKTHT